LRQQRPTRYLQVAGTLGMVCGFMREKTMTFSKRVGMEPATDLKKRICSLCEEAGFIVAASQISMHRAETLQESIRLILTYVHQPDWDPTVPDAFAGSVWGEHKRFQIEVRAFIGCDGTFSGMVQLLCSATDQVGDVFCPTLRDCCIPIADLPHWLPEITRQMREVIAGRTRGEQGPWRFSNGQTRWESWT
jgi:hypothetical protein